LNRPYPLQPAFAAGFIAARLYIVINTASRARRFADVLFSRFSFRVVPAVAEQKSENQTAKTRRANIRLNKSVAASVITAA